MLWRLWGFLCGLPLGALVALVAGGTVQWLAWGAAASGVALGVGVGWLGGFRDDEPERSRHLAAAAGSAWLALPAGLAVWLGLAPDPWIFVALVMLATGAALFVAARAIGPAGGGVRWLARALGFALLGGPALFGLAAGWAGLHGPAVREPVTSFASAVYDLDARVATRPLPACSAKPRALRVLSERGAHPSLSADGRFVWFDAASAEDGGRRQIHRLDRNAGTSECWTCGEPGDNVRPAVGDGGRSLVFESDRGAGWRHPDDSDVYQLSTRRKGSSRRLTFSPGPDARPLLAPASRIVAWSRRERGRYEVVAAAIRSGHGGLLLGNVGVLATGGARWVAPLAWSPDARTLVIGRGNPFAPLEAIAIDPATSSAARLGDDVVAAGFVADGAWLAVATAQGEHPAGALPEAFGFALGPWADALSRRRPLLRGSGVRSGAASDPDAASALELSDEVARWGAPTGLALEPDGSGLLLGQRRSTPDGVEERLLEIAFQCDLTALARAGEPR
jgi:hypothetical protein